MGHAALRAPPAEVFNARWQRPGQRIRLARPPPSAATQRLRGCPFVQPPWNLPASRCCAGKPAGSCGVVHRANDSRTNPSQCQCASQRPPARCRRDRRAESCRSDSKLLGSRCVDSCPSFERPVWLADVGGLHKICRCDLRKHLVPSKPCRVLLVPEIDYQSLSVP